MEANTLTPDLISAVMKRAAASRRIVEGMCEACGTPIRGLTRRRYCSNTCRASASYRRRQAAKKAAEI